MNLTSVFWKTQAMLLFQQPSMGFGAPMNDILRGPTTLLGTVGIEEIHLAAADSFLEVLVCG